MMSVWYCESQGHYFTAESKDDGMYIKVDNLNLDTSQKIRLDKETVEELVKLCEIHLDKLKKKEEK